MVLMDIKRRISKVNEYSSFERHLVTMETVPSVAGGLLPEIHSGGLDKKLKFNEVSLGIVTDANGRDIVGHAINPSYEQGRETFFGTFEGNHSPTNIFQMADSFKNESLAKPHEMDMYCAVIGIAFEQDAVPYMKAESPDNLNNELHFGLQLDFEESFDKRRFEDLAELFQVHAEGVEFTVIGDRTVRAVNFSDDQGIPFAMSNDEFIMKVLSVAEIFPTDESIAVSRLRVSGNYIFNDWDEHPEGEGYKSLLAKNGRSDLILLAEEMRSKFLAQVKLFAKEMDMPEKTAKRRDADEATLSL